VRNVDPRLVKVSKNKDTLTISIAYERREHLIANLDVVAVFDKKVEVPIR
jgi:hypothetical protein